MTVVQKRYFTVQSVIIDPYDPFSPPPQPIPPPTGLTIKDPIAECKLPDWFMNDRKHQKIIRVLGATVNKLNLSITPDPEMVEAMTGGWRLFSNIDSQTNLKMKTALTANDALLANCSTVDVGFIMMINNYNSIKEYDITNDNITDVRFYIRPWNSWTNYPFYIDCIVELELLLIDNN